MQKRLRETLGAASGKNLRNLSAASSLGAISARVRLASFGGISARSRIASLGGISAQTRIASFGGIAAGTRLASFGSVPAGARIASMGSASYGAQPGLLDAMRRSSFGVQSGLLHPQATGQLVRAARPIAARVAAAPVERLEAAEVAVESNPLAAALLHELRGMRKDLQQERSTVADEMAGLRNDMAQDRADAEHRERRALLFALVLALMQMLADHPPAHLVETLRAIGQALTQQLPPGGY